MTRKPFRSALALLILAACVSLAATQLRPSVMGSGGGTAASESYVLDGTAGQPAPIGIAAGATYQLQGGVWYGAGPALISCGSAAAAADADADLLTNAEETAEGTDPCDVDTDDDHCADSEELEGDIAFGGLRDPLDLWDFYDVTEDASIDLSDTLAVLALFGLTPEDRDYDELFDRYIPNATFFWRPAQAVNEHLGIDLGDALANLQSFGHSCAGDP